jgi:hypothetical protein
MFVNTARAASSARVALVFVAGEEAASGQWDLNKGVRFS